MIQSENKIVIEMHGCIVCAKLFSILAVYTPEGRLVNCAVTSYGGQRVMDEQHPLVACESHSTDKIEAAYKRWKSINDQLLNHKQEDN
jgi:hypothetical protein